MLFLTPAELACRSAADVRRDRLMVVGIVVTIGMIFCAMRLGHIAVLDFPCFYVAGKLVGSAHFYHFRFFTEYEHRLGFDPEIFPYPAAFAALFAPLARLPIKYAYIVYSCALSACGGAAAWLLVQRLRMKARLSACVLIGWLPTATNFSAAQNSIVAFLLAFLLIDSIERRQEIAAGIWAGLALFKPTFGVFFVGWLLFERRWKAAGVAALVAAGWYLASVPATGGNWGWPLTWMRLLAAYQPLDFVATQWLHVGLFSALIHLHVPAAITGCLILVLWAAALSAARTYATADRFIFLLALIPALSPHALLYDGVFTLPALFRLMQLEVPFARWWFYAAYAIGATSLSFMHSMINPSMVPVVVTPLIFVFAMNEQHRMSVPRSDAVVGE